ncbi:hypothetical protein BpHYR1_024996 [Brachionus plicatilis]|uniref:Uncharacterized protein n=1 Tax=Brachionus plicatilis TaxID=10195 RepID=A0A3M7RV12_BRAPC|nr:hypothetical protein BpHYR1_024996 [Brachionus plicatilis]
MGLSSISFTFLFSSLFTSLPNLAKFFALTSKIFKLLNYGFCSLKDDDARKLDEYCLKYK